MARSPKIKTSIHSTGVKPALQGRSKKRRDELIATGMDLLCEKNFSDISIIELTSACGYSVGTFYSRFNDKESFFIATQKAAVSLFITSIEEEFSNPSWNSASSEEIFSTLVNVSVDLLSTNLRGVVRGSIAMAASNPEAWEPIHKCGETLTLTLLELLKDRFIGDAPYRSEDSIKFGMQMLFGTLAQAILNDKVNVRLTSPEMRKNLTNMLIVYTQLKPE